MPVHCCNKRNSANCSSAWHAYAKGENPLNKTALKTFATEARKELLERIKTKAMQLGITEESIAKADIASSNAIFINGEQLVDFEIIQRNKLISRINEIGFERVIDEVAYTWFNRLTALRFMEVNDYLPTRTRVLSSEGNPGGEPDMMKEALTLDLDLDKELVYDLMVNNNTDELFRYLIKAHCNDLNRYMPFMFETIEDYTAILFPDGLLAPDSFLRKMTDTDVIPEDNWEKIEVIGWLYQYYIAEEKERVFKAKKKYKSEEIPYATQLFTPDWIVQYMVQNSLGRTWIESHPEHKELQDNWEYYLEKQDENMEEKLAPYINKDLKVEDIKCFDPAMGSGHILVYMFDVLHEIYSKSGYIEREIPKLIIENNLYGLDIDDRAFQLASFSVVMKALEYDKRFLRAIEREGLSLNLAAIQETNLFTDDDITYLVGENKGKDLDNANAFIQQYQHAKSIGSLIKVIHCDMEFLEKRLRSIEDTPVTDLFESEKREKVLSLIPRLIRQNEIMEQYYDVLVTNPPYMSSRGMNKELSVFLRKNYPDSKGDLFAAFMELDNYIKPNGFYASINQHSWMFLSSFEKLRKKIINDKFIDTMLHLGPRAFEEIGGEVVQSTTFVLRNAKIQNGRGTYLRLINENSASKKRKNTIEAVQNPLVSYRFSFDQQNLSKIPGSPIAYWLSDNAYLSFEEFQSLGERVNIKSGLQSSDNNRFLKLWFEVSKNEIGFNITSRETAKELELKWFTYNKGGYFRKWYGNNEYVVNWGNDGKEIRDYSEYINTIKASTMGVAPNSEYYFQRHISWSLITSTSFSCRYYDTGMIFDISAPSIFAESQNELMIYLALLNSKVANFFINILNPTINFSSGVMKRLPSPIINDNYQKNLVQLSNQNVEISKEEWNDFEISWDFAKHPLIKHRKNNSDIGKAFGDLSLHMENQFNNLKMNEEELNNIFINLYGIEKEMTPHVENKDIALRKSELGREVRSFISYAIGCSFGRYSLDQEGLIYAGGELDPSRYEVFKVDKDNILPILPGAYFEDDIVSRFVEFVGVTFGEEALSENLDFVADALTRRKNETARETLRRYFMNEFYKDHVKIYKKRPIYWQFTSGKEKAFNCLIYMHRYDKTTLSRIRTDYLHEYQVRLDSEKEDLMNVIDGDSTTKQINDAKKELKSLEKKIVELKKYDEVLHHMADMQIEIDLDDGVKVNYEKFKGLMAKI